MLVGEFRKVEERLDLDARVPTREDGVGGGSGGGRMRSGGV